MDQYGSDSGLDTGGSQWLLQSELEEYDQFGAALTTGDFDNDGYADLAVGALGESTDTAINVGAVTVVYGTSAGLAIQPTLQTTFFQDDAGGITESYDFFGASVVSGDLNGDGYYDLAVGAPWETLNGPSQAGAVNILYGSVSGLSSTNAEE